MLGGGFSWFNGQSAQAGLAKLDASGALVDGISYQSLLGATGGGVNSSLSMQADGKLVVADYYSSENKAARLLANGQRDTFGDLSASQFLTSNTIRTMTMQSDGKILIGGGVDILSCPQRRGLARLLNDPAPQAVNVAARQRVEWTRGGAAPEVEQVTFELSTDGGGSWTPLGAGVRMAGGWERTGLALPGGGSIRARGRTLSGAGGSSGIVETVAPFSRITPEISIQQPDGVELVTGAGTADFGSVVVDSNVPRAFTIRNTWTGELTGVSLALTPDGTPGDFTITPPPAATLAPAASMTFAVTVNSSAVGPRSALLRVASNDEDESPFEIALIATGRVPTPLEAWRTIHHTTRGPVRTSTTRMETAS